MTDLSEIARDLGDIVDDTGNDWDRMTIEQLTAMMQGIGVASFQSSCLLVGRCGDSVERARVQISRAMDLPAAVLRRRAKEAADIINADEVPNIPQHSAHIAMMLKMIQNIGARIDRRQSGATLN